MRMAHDERKNPRTRIVALDLHPRSFGYAAFEGASLLDWGTCRWRAGNMKTAGRKIRRLIRHWQPKQLVIRQGSPKSEYGVIAASARRLGMPVLKVPRLAVRDAFRSGRPPSRFDIARIIAERYPALATCLPAARKLGHAEPFQLRMFNAMATGMAVLGILALRKGDCGEF